MCKMSVHKKYDFLGENNLKATENQNTETQDKTPETPKIRTRSKFYLFTN